MADGENIRLLAFNAVNQRNLGLRVCSARNVVAFMFDSFYVKREGAFEDMI